MSLEKLFHPRKAQKFSKRYQTVGHMEAGGTPSKIEWLIQRNILIYFVFFVLFVDKLRFSG